MLVEVTSKPIRTRSRNMPVSKVELRQPKAVDCPYEMLWSLQSHLLKGSGQPHIEDRV